MDFSYSPGATPIDPDEAAGLLPRHITTQAELNAWEEANFVTAEGWAFRQKKRELLEEGFVRELHRKMFNKTVFSLRQKLHRYSRQVCVLQQCIQLDIMNA